MMTLESIALLESVFPSAPGWATTGTGATTASLRGERDINAPAIGGSARRANRQVPQGVAVWHPASRVSSSASHGVDRGFSAATYSAARMHIPATPAPQEGLQSRAGIAPRAGVAAASGGIIVGGARTEASPREAAPAAVSRPSVEFRPAPEVREQPSVSAFGGPDNAFEARQSSARGFESRSTDVRAIVRFRSKAMKKNSAPK